MEIKMDRDKLNMINEQLLNEELHKRGISEEYHFGICERVEHEHSRFLDKDFTFNYWNLALYKTDGIFGTRIEQIHGTPLVSNEDYENTNAAIGMTLFKIQHGFYDNLKEEVNYNGKTNQRT